jgi:RNA polymerase sigma factor for flagellar operon FliA
MSKPGDRPPLTPDQRALVAKHASLVERLMRTMPSFFASTMGRDELCALGYMGLVEAAQSFDATVGAPFEVFATARARGAMLDGIRRAAPHLRALTEASAAASTDLERDYEPTRMSDTDRIERDRLDTCSGGMVFAMISAHSGAIHRMGEDGMVARDLYAKTRHALREALECLPARELPLVFGHHIEGRPLREIAAEIGMPYRCEPGSSG